MNNKIMIRTKGGKMKNKINIGIFLLVLAAIILQASFASADVGLNVALSKYDPVPAAPGQTVKLWLLVQNTGDTDAKDVTVQIVPQSPFSLYNQDNDTKTISILGAQKDYLIDFNLKVDPNAIQGANYVTVRYSQGLSGVQEKNLEIDVQVRDTSPSIENVTVDPTSIEPGSDGRITITVKNNAQTTLTDLSLKLQLQAVIGGSLVDLPFAPIDSGIEKRVDLLSPGDTAEFSYDLKAYPDAVSNVYKIPFTLSYYDSQGTQINKTDFIGIVVNSVPDVVALIDKSDLTTKKTAGTVTIKVINKGLSDIKFLNVILGTSQDYDIVSDSTTNYVGNLVSDDYQTVDYTIDVHNGKNTVTLPVTLQYRDANNQVYSVEQDVSLKLIDDQKLNAANGTGGISIVVIVVIILIIAGILWWYIRKKNKKNKKGQF